MSTINVPFELDPWCVGCPNIRPDCTTLFASSCAVEVILSCTHLSECRWAVASALKMNKGGDGHA